MGRREREARSGDRGQTTVEFALVLPLGVVLLVLLVQMGLLVREQLLVAHAAREAARAAAVDPDEAAALDAAVAGAPLDADRLEVELTGGRVRGERLTAVVAYRAVTDLPFVGPLVPDLTLRAEATMRVE